MARNATATGMISSGGLDEPLLHGGDLAAARRLFPDAPEPFLDLSTGINPNPYPVPEMPPGLFARLPEAGALEALASVAVKTYGAPSVANVVPAPGTQILLPMVASLAPPGRAIVVSPTYVEHARAARLAGHQVIETGDLRSAGASLVVVTNPNNPDGRLFSRDALLAAATDLLACGGILVVDEAFMDVGPADASLAAELGRGNIVVLRSFGKFFGLGGVRLGFALAAPPLATRLAALLGPWAVSSAAIAIGTAALGDHAWIDRTRRELSTAAARLDAILAAAGLDIVGGTSLFRLAQSHKASEIFHCLGRAGIIARLFPDQPSWLRFGLPAGEKEWQRLQIALAGCGGNR